MAQKFFPEHTPKGSELTKLILQIFRVNGRLLAAGDRLTSNIGLTSARWQVLGAIAVAHAAQPVANIARNMGLTRQAVQRIVNELAAEEFVTFAPNPHHRRAKLVVMTKKGQGAYQAAARRQAPWVNRLADELKEKDIAAAKRVVSALVESLESAEGGVDNES